MRKFIIWSIIPPCFLIMFWWISASLQLFHIVELSDNIIATIAISGLVIGIIVTMITYKFLYANFYTIPYKYLSILYFFLSAIGFAFMMGIPLLILLLGSAAGIYLGQRLHFLKDYQKNVVVRVSLFSAMITGFWVLFICMLIRRDEASLRLIEQFIGIGSNIIVGRVGIICIVFIVFLISCLQYYLTYFSTNLTYRSVNK